ncbi:hypothetical protein E1B28_000862 [Marasmius oreades]|uniref:Uncharacterized protein n=1 Tax=Marasmius oreades TaxID=181124 RepID=A0A9P7V2B1_9AGAR|nr:uncharacterized protein E1B28_000862 [Marasmius oreades]KAG7098975.1 hypothetical protein E1B28_000862 [Marasmius oreades]
MNRPRFSVLEEFDPLVAEQTEPITPTALDLDREDELSDPEKENTVPANITMHTFFTKGYKKIYSTPVKLTKRLIDVGDVTVASAGEEGDLNGEDQEDENDEGLYLPTTPKSTIVKHISNTPRTPLADIPFQESTGVPLHRETSQTHCDCLPQLSKKTLSFQSLPLHSTLSLVINTINSTGTAFGKSQSATSPTALPKPEDNGHPLNPPRTPRIQVHSPETDLAKPESLLNHVSAPFDMTELDHNDPDTSSDTSLLAPPVPRENRVQASSDDLIRQSLDLHTSFQLQLQFPESSFDLLNDKISFLDGSSRALPSFLLEDDSDDFEGKMHDEDTAEEGSSVTPTNSLTPEKLPVTYENISPEGDPSAQPTSPISPTAMIPTTAKVELTIGISSPKGSKVSSMVPKEPDTAALLAPIAVERGAIFSTPGYRNSVPFIPPVPALRIIKRTKRFQAKVPKPSDAAATCPPLCMSPASEISGESSEISGHRPQIIKEQVARPPSSSTTVPMRRDFASIREDKAPSAPAIRLTRTSQPVQPAKPGGPMPMRIAPAMFSTSRPQNILAQRGLSHQTSGAGSNGNGNVISSRRVLVPEADHEKLVAKPNPSFEAAKRTEQGLGRAVKMGSAPPARTTYNIGGMSSGVPRPAGMGSRLPAPTSGIARFKGTTTAVSGGVAIRGLPAPRRAT